MACSRRSVQSCSSHSAGAAGAGLSKPTCVPVAKTAPPDRKLRRGALADFPRCHFYQAKRRLPYNFTLEDSMGLTADNNRTSKLSPSSREGSTAKMSRKFHAVAREKHLRGLRAPFAPGRAKAPARALLRAERRMAFRATSGREALATPVLHSPCFRTSREEPRHPRGPGPREPSP